ncbi:MAG: hypothetical protein H9535_19270 [Ignavibacteria bacterium]|nr:hypothetical protein [Ignavibacteria bacterium]
MASILKDLTAGQPIERGVTVDPKLVLRGKLVEQLTTNLVASKLGEAKYRTFEKTITQKKRGGEEITKNVRFRPMFGKNAFGDWVVELKFGNKALPLPHIKTHVLKAGKKFEDVTNVLSKLIEATNTGELDGVLIKASNERKESRAKRDQQAA